MFLSDRDLQFAVETKQLIISPPPVDYDTTSIDLHLDAVEKAAIWNTDSFAEEMSASGQVVVLNVGRFNYKRFFLWQTREQVGTPEENPRLICFVEGRSSIARTGLIVHLTAPTIHAGWWGNITLELANLGPFEIGLHEGDPIAQLTVSTISSPPLKNKQARGIAVGQASVSGQATTLP